MAIILEQLPSISEGDVEWVAIDYTLYLDASETLTGTPTAVEQTTSDLTLASAAVSVSALTILGKSVSTGQAVRFKVSGQQAGTTYDVLVTAATTGGRTKKVIARLTCVE